VDLPETRFAWNGDVSLAYQVLGAGPTDLVYLPGWASNVDVHWQSPPLSRFLRDLAARTRLIITDRRGWGCSDRFSPTDVPPIETLTQDLLVVMDAAGSERAAILTTLEGSVVTCLFAATYPDRVMALILADPLVKYEATDDMPWLPGPDRWIQIAENIHDDWGTRAYFPEPYMDDTEAEWYARFQRASFARGAFVAEIERYRAVDIRSVLPSIQAPTLILADVDAESLPNDSGHPFIENARYIVGHIPGARIVEHKGGDRLWWYPPTADVIVGETTGFLGSLRTEEATFDRVLATILFTDIVGSTEKAAELGDAGWGQRLERHHSVVRALLARYRGTEIDTAGDGFFATFEGPARAVRCAQAIIEAMRPLGLQIRAGIHTGEIETVAEKAGGIAVIIGSRIMGEASPSEVLVSQTVKDLTAGSGLKFEDAGEHELKGVPDRWHLYRVTGR